MRALKCAYVLVGGYEITGIMYRYIHIYIYLYTYIYMYRYTHIGTGEAGALVAGNTKWILKGFVSFYSREGLRLAGL